MTRSRRSHWSRVENSNVCTLEDALMGYSDKNAAFFFYLKNSFLRRFRVVNLYNNITYMFIVIFYYNRIKKNTGKLDNLSF